MNYVARYTESRASNTVELTLSAETDTAAVAEIRDLVASGFRNEAMAQVDLSDGRVYGAANKHGVARGAYLT